jgi:hypothetical protein
MPIDPVSFYLVSWNCISYHSLNMRAIALLTRDDIEVDEIIRIRRILHDILFDWSSLVLVVLFPAMKTICMLVLLIPLSGCYYINQKLFPDDYIITADRDIPAGTVLQASDVRLNACGEGFSRDDLLVPARVIGHKTLRPLTKGGVIHRSDIFQWSRSTKEAL